MNRNLKIQPQLQQSQTSKKKKKKNCVYLSPMFARSFCEMLLPEVSRQMNGKKAFLVHLPLLFIKSPTRMLLLEGKSKLGEVESFLREQFFLKKAVTAKVCHENGNSQKLFSGGLGLYFFPPERMFLYFKTIFASLRGQYFVRQEKQHLKGAQFLLLILLSQWKIHKFSITPPLFKKILFRLQTENVSVAKDQDHMLSSN